MEITGIRGLMMWRGEAKSAQVTAERLYSHIEDINSWDVSLHSLAWPHD